MPGAERGEPGKVAPMVGGLFEAGLATIVIAQAEVLLAMPLPEHHEYA